MLFIFEHVQRERKMIVVVYFIKSNFSTLKPKYRKDIRLTDHDRLLNIDLKSALYAENAA